MNLAGSGFTLHRCCIKCSPTPTGVFVVFLNVDNLQAFYMNWGGEGEFAYGCLKCFWLCNFSDLFWNCDPDADGSRVK